MDIATLEEIKTLLQINTDQHDDLINMLIPLVQDDMLKYMNNKFIDKHTHKPVYPPALKLYMARMVNFRMQKMNENISSESLSRHSITYNTSESDNIGGYPSIILSGLNKWRKINWGV